MKKCSKCKRDLPADKYHFFTANETKDRLRYSCKECGGHKFSKPKGNTKVGYKICTKCRVELPLTSDYFYTEKICLDGFRSDCKICNNEINKQWKIRNTISISKYNSRYRKEHGESIRRRIRRNKEKYVIYEQKRRSRKKNLPSTLTTQQWEQAKLNFDNKCAYCAREYPLVQDHFIPLSNGGEYSHNNILPSCIFCNSSKRDKEFIIWYRGSKYYSKQREVKILKYLGYTKGIQQLSLMC